MKIYYKRDGTEVQGAVNLKHFNDLNNHSDIEYLEFSHVLRQLSPQNIPTILQAAFHRMSSGGTLYITDLDIQQISNTVRFNHITIEDANQLLFQQGNASCLALFWIKLHLEQAGFQIHSCGYGYQKDFWIKAMK